VPVTQSAAVALASLRFVVVGAGQLGSSLALAMRARGADLLGFTAHTATGRARAEAWLGGRATVHVQELMSLSPRLVVVAVPDDALLGVADELGADLRHRPPRPDLVVAHTSGATSVTALSPCQRAGASTLVFHPLQTFTDPSSGSARFAGAAIAITPSVMGEASPAAALGFALANGLGARPFLLPDDKRGLYHAAATLACNYLVALEHLAEQLFITAGLPKEEALSLFLPLVEATLDNIGARGTVAALTGPLSRGDTRTVSEHLRALAVDAPDLLPAYRLLGLATLDLVRLRADISPATIAELGRLLATPDPPPLLESSR
jgi:predicted short-subunit dehydrogenase-like oxidoreductase (DUF2520 family)